MAFWNKTKKPDFEKSLRDIKKSTDNYKQMNEDLRPLIEGIKDKYRTETQQLSLDFKLLVLQYYKQHADKLVELFSGTASSAIGYLEKRGTAVEDLDETTKLMLSCMLATPNSDRMALEELINEIEAKIKNKKSEY